MCGTGECVMEGDLCDEDVDCLDNSDVKFCKVVNGKRVQVLPEDVSFHEDPNLVGIFHFHRFLTEASLKL